MEGIKLPEHMVFGLDIGTRSIVGTVGFRKNEREFVVAAQCIRFHETRAMLDGQIHDIGKVAATIGEVKRELELKIGRKLGEVCIAAAGRVLQTVTVFVEQELDGEAIIGADHIRSMELLGVEKAHNELQEKTLTENVKFYCVGYSIIHYYLNGYPIMNLEGHKARVIGADVLATFLPEEVVDGLYVAVERAGLSVINLTLEPIAAMQIAIPEKFRLLNLALVDIGAGTSDISVTKDGSIIAYGMIPSAGDILTEIIVQKYLVDFQTAEKMKMEISQMKPILFLDIMGLEQTVDPEILLKDMEEAAGKLADQIAQRIRDLNGGKSVSAAFVIGGGGKLPNFTEMMAAQLGLVKERVALRGEEVLGEVKFLQPEIEKDPTLVTPIGICLNYYEQNNNFIFVRVNHERVKLYDNGKLTIIDAALTIGYPNEDLFPKRGKALEFTFNGSRRMVRGEPGEAAVILLNGREVGINTPITLNDVIEITSSSAGAPASVSVGDLKEYKSTISFLVNGRKVVCPKFMQANGNLVSEFYEIKEQDELCTIDFYTVSQVFDFMDIIVKGTVLVNHIPSLRTEKVYENFSIDFNLSELELNELVESRAMSHVQEAVSEPKEPIRSIQVSVNKTPVVLHGKPKYIYVDILDFYEFDTSHPTGEALILRVNDVQANFTTPIEENDSIDIFWE